MTDRITIVALGDMGEATALRAVLESMGFELRLLRPEAPGEVAESLARGSEDDVVILSAKGSKRGLYLGAHAAKANAALMDGDWLPARAALGDVRFRPDSVLVSTAGAARESGLVSAMFQAGGHLIAPNGTPDRQVIVPWVAACLLHADKELAEAVALANGLVTPQNHFSYG